MLRVFGRWGVLALTVASVLLLSGTIDRSASLKADSTVPSTVRDPLTDGREAYLNVPMVFEPNRGQAETAVLYLARAAGYTLAIHRGGARMALRGDRGRNANVLEMDLAHALMKPVIEAEAPQPGHSNYIIGNDAARHLTDIPQFGRVVAKGVYPGIDVAYYGRQSRLEYDFIVAPGADPGQIGLRFSGSDSMTIDADGDLVFRWGTRELRQHKPVLYELPGRTPVNGRFTVAADGTVGFSVDRWDRTKTLVIDPTLAFGSYLGGNDTDTARAVAVDAAGSIYVGGFTASTNFPAVGAYQAAKGDANPLFNDAFVTKINAAGTAILYSTYVGGNATDEGYGLAIDAAGSAYLAGSTTSSNFPTNSPITLGCSTGDAFLTKLTPAGNAISYSLCFGTGGTDRANAVSVDSTSRAYVTGLNGATDAFVGRLNAAGSAFEYYKVVGGTATGDEGFGIAADAAGNVCVTGATPSTDFPTTNPRQAVSGGGQDAFAIKYDTAGTAVFSTYLGGSGTDGGNSAAIDAAANCYFTGTTSSTNFPTTGPAQPSNGGLTDVFVTAYSATGSAYIYSTYLGGAGSDSGWAIVATGPGAVHVVGQSNSVNYPVLNPTQAALKDTGSVHVSANAGSTFASTALALGDPVQALVVDPANSSLILAGTSVGIYRSTNGGVNWTAVTGNLTYQDVRALAIDPNDHCAIWAGIDTHATAINTNAVLVKSTDCGVNWGLVANTPLGQAVRSLAVSSDSATLYLDFQEGLTISTSQERIVRWNGATQSVAGPGSTGVYRLAADPTPGNACSAYAGDLAGIVYQNTACSPTAPNWAQIGLTLTGGINTIAPHPTSAGTLIAGTTAGNIYRKANGASAWVSVATISGSINSIVYQPGNPTVVYAAGGGGVLYKSTDGGATWLPSSTIGPAVASLAVTASAANNVYAGTVGTNDAFYTRLSPAGTIVDSTLFGGHGADAARGVAIDPSGNAVVVGTTDATDFPVSVGAVAAVKAAGTDAFIARIAPSTACVYGLSSTTRSIPAAAGGDSVGVTTSGTGTCAAWTAVSNVPWLVVTGGANGAGVGTVSYTATANTAQVPRIGTITIAGVVLTVTQAPPPGSDINGDGSQDLLWRNYASGAVVAWYLNGTSVVGQGIFQAVPDPAWQLIGTADVNGDGHPDAIWRNTTTGAGVVWYLNGTTILNQVSLPTVADLTWQLQVIADINSDGSPDLIWRNQVTGQNVVWYMNGVTLVGQVALSTVADLSWTIAASADMNADGYSDLLWRNVQTGETVVWYLNGVSVIGQYSLPTVPDLAWTLVAAMDVNTDGAAELFWRHKGTGANVVWTMTGIFPNGQVSLPGVPDTTWRVAGPTAARSANDANGDQHPDLWWRNTSTGTNVVWFLNGTTLVAQESLPNVPDQAWQRVASADLNYDGYPDVIWRNNVTGANVAWLMNGSAVRGQLIFQSVPDLNWKLVAAADINEDAKPDLIWRNSASGAIVVWYLDGTTILNQVNLPAVADPAWRISATADMNGDGHADLIWRNVTTGSNVVWYLNGPGQSILSQVALPPVADLPWQIALAADVDRDGHPDLIWRNGTTGANVVWFLNGTTLLSQASLPSVPEASWVLRQ